MAELKHFKRKGAGDRNRLFLLFQVQLEIQDVRSGFRGSSSLLYAAPPLKDRDLNWTPDMLISMKWDEVEEIPPPRREEWPGQADDQIIGYFARYHTIPIWRNYELGLYGYPGEKKEELIERSIEALSQEREVSMAKIRDIFLRRFLEIEQKKLDEIQEDEWAPEADERRSMEIREVFSRIREQFSNCFIRQNLEPLRPDELNWPEIADLEYRDRLEFLRAEFVESVNQISRQLRSSANRIDRHEVSVAHSDIEIASRAFLWGP